MEQVNKLWLKTPYPNEKGGEGFWKEMTTPYERRLWKKHHSRQWLPTRKQPYQPAESEV